MGVGGTITRLQNSRCKIRYSNLRLNHINWTVCAQHVLAELAALSLSALFKGKEEKSGRRSKEKLMKNKLMVSRSWSLSQKKINVWSDSL